MGIIIILVLVNLVKSSHKGSILENTQEKQTCNFNWNLKNTKSHKVNIDIKQKLNEHQKNTETKYNAYKKTDYESRLEKNLSLKLPEMRGTKNHLGY